MVSNEKKNSVFIIILKQVNMHDTLNHVKSFVKKNKLEKNKSIRICTIFEIIRMYS